MGRKTKEQIKKERDIAYHAEYDKNNYKKLYVRFGIESDKDIIQHLESVGNKNNYIKKLIREDISKKD